MQRYAHVLWLMLLPLFACSGCGLAVLVVASHNFFIGLISLCFFVTGHALLFVFRPPALLSQEKPTPRWYGNPDFSFALAMGSGTILLLLGEVLWHLSADLPGEKNWAAIFIPSWYTRAWTIFFGFPMVGSLVLSVCRWKIWRRLLLGLKQVKRSRAR